MRKDEAQGGHQRNTSRKLMTERSQKSTETRSHQHHLVKKLKSEITCFKCYHKGHYAAESTKENYSCTTKNHKPEPQFDRKGQVNGGPVVKMKIDTGCARTKIHTSIIPPVCIKESTIEMIAATVETRYYKLADLTLMMNGEQYNVEAAVLDKLPVPVLLGKDLPLVKFIVDGLTKVQVAVYTTERNRVEDTEGPACDDNLTSPPEENIAVMTRCQARTQVEAEEQTQREEQKSQGRPTLVQGNGLKTHDQNMNR